MILFAAHTIGFIIYWGTTHQMAEVIRYWSNFYEKDRSQSNSDLVPREVGSLYWSINLIFIVL